ncbi:MAG: LysM peptidoglycan-binding domain-containing protein [Ferruginibacter sp.]|nr:LysM peptidoglycan-binding domain-containing protein [Ferruginibacter sp.]
MMFKCIATILFSFVTLQTIAQRTTVEEYINQFKQTAMDEMKRSGVPAAITLAQGILESESGNSELVKKSNNHFGIKCKTTWTGDTVSHDDDANGECFRAYKNASDSYRDHSDFLRGNKRYADLFKLNQDDYAGWAKGLKKAGYATNPRYPDLLIKYVEQYNLQQYSLAVLNNQPPVDIALQTQKDEQTATVTNSEKATETTVADNIVNAENNNPENITSINAIKCVFVKKGTSLLAIANKYDISLSKLMEFNDMLKDGILDKDQYVFLHKKSMTGAKDFYITQPGETIYDIAQKNGIQLQYLLAYNHLNADATLQPNTKLILKPGLKIEVDEAVKNNFKIHVVEPKEGLYAIARKYKVTVQQLKEWNSLQNDDLKPGQQIKISK